MSLTINRNCLCRQFLDSTLSLTNNNDGTPPDGKPMPKLAANLSMMFNEVDFMTRFRVAAEAGFKGVEYLFPYDYPAGDILAELEKHGLTQVLHNLPAGDWDTGERGIACLPDRVDEFKDGVIQGIEYATTLGCTQINCLAGVRPDNVDHDTAHDTLVDNLRFAAGELQKANISLLIEAINTRDIPGFYITTTDQAKSIINNVGSQNLRLQYDIYHMQIMEGDLIPTIEQNLDLIQHIQLADNPGRNEPGTGEINYPNVLSAVDSMGYNGWIGCEYKPKTTTIDGLVWASRYLGQVNHGD